MPNPSNFRYFSARGAQCIPLGANVLANRVVVFVGHWPHLPSHRRRAARSFHPLAALWWDMVPAAAADVRFKSSCFHGEIEKLLSSLAAPDESIMIRL